VYDAEYRIRDLGQLLACSATARHFREYRETRPKDATASVNRVLQMVRAAFRVAQKRGEITRVPFIEIVGEKGNERQGFASEQQVTDLLAALPDDALRDFVEWGFETGQRKSEIAALTWAMYEASENQIHIPGNLCKNRKARSIALGPALRGIHRTAQGAAARRWHGRNGATLRVHLSA
jgi:integrase